MHQDVAQSVTLLEPAPRAPNDGTELANLSSYLAAMAIAVGLIIAWAGFCAF